MEENQKTESIKVVGEKAREGNDSFTEAAVNEKQSNSGNAVGSKPNGALLSTSQEEFPAFGFGACIYIYIYIFLKVDSPAFALS